MDTVPVAHLLLDEGNPRLPLLQNGQPATLHAMAKAQGSKLRFLAEDIARYGLDPSYRLIVMPSDTTPGRFIVLDGNRRLTAIRALEDPDEVQGVVSRSVLNALRDLSPGYLASPVMLTECLVVGERAEADHWIELRHTGQHRGAGVVGWASGEASRFRARRSGKPDIATQALDFLEARGDISPEFRGDVPASTLGRLLGTRDVRPLVGFDTRGGRFTPTGDEAALADKLLQVTKDLASGAVGVGDLYSSKQRVEYAERLADGVGITNLTPEQPPEPTIVTEPPRLSLVDANDDGRAVIPEAQVSLPGIRGPRVSVRERDLLIPPSFRMNVTVPRLRKLESEIRNLPLSQYPNANAVLFRVFLELTADEYIDRAELTAVNIDSRLPAKLNAVTSDLVQSALLSDQEAQPVRRAAQASSYEGIGTLLMNQWIHNRYMFPSASELRTGWDNFQPWFRAIWPVAGKPLPSSE